MGRNVNGEGRRRRDDERKGRGDAETEHGTRRDEGRQEKEEQMLSQQGPDRSGSKQETEVKEMTGAKERTYRDSDIPGSTGHRDEEKRRKEQRRRCQLAVGRS